jgi:hypothetical protein
MLVSTKPPHYLLRMGSHAERFYFEWASPLYDALILNANLVEGTPAACLSLIEKLSDKPYVIDPVSHAFALPVSYIQSTKINRRTGEEEVSTKRTFQKLAERYGEPFTNAVGDDPRPLTPEDFTNALIRQHAVGRILTYEKDRLMEEQPQSGPLRAAAGDVRPKVLIIPYFFIDSARAWHSTNIDMINDAVALEMELPTYAVVLIDRAILQDSGTLKNIAQDYCDTKADGYFIWVSDQTEHEMGIQEVKSFIQFVKMLCSDGRPIYNMYGGYLSALLSAFGMTGFCHGAGYGEHRNVVPVLGGGVPPAKYYFPPLHQIFVFTEAQTILATLSTEEYYNNICNCPVCHDVIGDNFQSNFQQYGETEFKRLGKWGQEVYIQSANSVRICRGHYLAARFIETQRVRNSDPAGLVLQLREAEQSYRHSSGFPPTGYLHAWSEGISASIQPS